MRRRHSLCIGDMNIDGGLVLEKHSQLVADNILIREDEFKVGDVMTEYQLLGYLEVSYRAADRLLQRLRKKGMIEYFKHSQSWKRITIEAD